MIPANQIRFRRDLPPVHGPGEEMPRSENATLATISATLAHNVNNGLVAVIGHLELAMRANEDLGSVRTQLKAGLAVAFQVAERIRRLTAFTARGVPATLEKVRLVPLARALAERVRDSHSSLVVIVEEEGDSQVLGNPVLLEVILEQLVSNALEAMPGSGTLSIRVWEDGIRHCLSLTDTGEGLSPEVRRRLFEPYFTTKSFGHLGLGLALCHELLEAQGAALHVSSTEGQGTTVVLSFPPLDGQAVPTFAL